MTRDALLGRLHKLIRKPTPLPGKGRTEERHQRFFDVGRENLSLARLAEAHWDALAILAEAGKSPEQGAIYAVWAAEIPGRALSASSFSISGTKPFCSGAGLVDRALATVTMPEHLLLDLDLRGCGNALQFDLSSWKTPAFVDTNTATATFSNLAFSAEDIVGPPGFYLERPGFWHGACGPAACWAGGAAGLIDWALAQKRSDPHTLAHLGGLTAALWEFQACLSTSGRQIDADWSDTKSGQMRALTVRHLIEQGCTDVLRRLTRAYGPYPLAMQENISSRIQELELYIRQCHAERDLEALGQLSFANQAD